MDKNCEQMNGKKDSLKSKADKNDKKVAKTDAKKEECLWIRHKQRHEDFDENQFNLDFYFHPN